jgi:uncharacterized Zn-finger protein
MTSVLAQIAAADGCTYKSGDEAFPPLPRGSTLRGYQVDNRKKLFSVTESEATSTSKKIDNSTKTANTAGYVSTKFGENVTEEMSAAVAALMGVVQSKGAEIFSAKNKLSTNSKLPLVSSNSKVKRIVNPNTPDTSTKKMRNVRLVCEFCQYETNHSSHMVRHIRAHTGNKPHACSHCHYRCSQKNNLDRHIRARHSNLKPFKCPHCDYHSSQKSHINGHVRAKHSVKESFSCSDCAFVSSSLKYMENHMVAKHSKTFTSATATTTTAAPNTSSSRRNKAKPNQRNKGRKRGYIDISSFLGKEVEEHDEHPAFPGFWNASDKKIVVVPEDEQPMKKRKGFEFTLVSDSTKKLYKQNIMNHLDQMLISFFADPIKKKIEKTKTLLRTDSPTGILDLTCDEEM